MTLDDKLRQSVKDYKNYLLSLNITDEDEYNCNQKAIFECDEFIHQEIHYNEFINNITDSNACPYCGFFNQYTRDCKEDKSSFSCDYCWHKFFNDYTFLKSDGDK